MIRPALLFLASAALLVRLADAAPNTAARLPDVRGRYIVKLRSGVDSRAFSGSALETYRRDTDNTETNAVQFTYDTAFNGFAGVFSPGFIQSIQDEASVEYIVPDGVVTRMIEPVDNTNGHGRQQKPPSWGLVRTSQRKLDLAKDYVYPESAGEGVDVWVVDTGVWFNHTDFGGRASLAKSFVSGEDNIPDGNGHGTHCSGTVAGAKHGVAKKANILGVKVLSRYGSGTWAACIAGVDHVAKNVRKGKTIMSMSLGGGFNQAMNDAVTNAVKAGVVAVIASGNSAADACRTSPASAPGAIAVNAADNTDKLANFSNRGNCTHIAAPGVGITSAWIGAGDDKVNTISGTSMATPHVAGVAALLASQKNYESAEELKKDLLAMATKDAITNIPANTPNLLLFNGVSDE